MHPCAETRDSIAIFSLTLSQLNYFGSVIRYPDT